MLYEYIFVNFFSTGYLATKMKELHYLKDPPLFNAARPTRKNPY